jgi:hypothetical protein
MCRGSIGQVAAHLNITDSCDVLQLSVTEQDRAAEMAQTLE